MNQELKAKWVAALRSGKYTQTTGALRDDKGYCCLGVLLDVWGEGDWDEADYSCYVDESGEITVNGDLGLLARTLLGEEKINEEGLLVGLNDGDEKKNFPSQPFPVIADYIEKNL